ncbi:MAG TPA: hypothetical protein VMA75_05225 [Candidatus Paceibacterota bacterium]|nr:hypothetical protein [Candidatus Paceibacterota bacterium]
MQRVSLARTIAIFLAAAIVAGGGVLVYAYFHNVGGTPPAGPAASSTGFANIACMESPDYFVVDNGPQEPGLDVIAKHKTSPDETFPCADVTASSDVVVQNDLPEFVLGVTQRFLVIDSGTAPPPRGLIIYDLDAQTSTFSDTYAAPIDIATDTVTYWEATKQAPTAANCPDLAQYSADGLGAVIESHVTLDLSTMATTSLGAYQCEPTQ